LHLCCRSERFVEKNFGVLAVAGTVAFQEVDCHVCFTDKDVTLGTELLVDGTLFFVADAQGQTSIHYPPIHQFQYYQQLDQNRMLGLSCTEDIASREVTLPLYANMTAAQVDLVCQAVRVALTAATSSGRSI
jgi:hypothetical protein